MSMLPERIEHNPERNISVFIANIPPATVRTIATIAEFETAKIVETMRRITGTHQTLWPFITNGCSFYLLDKKQPQQVPSLPEPIDLRPKSSIETADALSVLAAPVPYTTGQHLERVASERALTIGAIISEATALYDDILSVNLRDQKLIATTPQGYPVQIQIEQTV